MYNIKKGLNNDMGDEIENAVETAAENTTDTPATLADNLINAGITREEIAETLREVLKESQPAPQVDTAAAEREYFTSLIGG